MRCATNIFFLVLAGFLGIGFLTIYLYIDFNRDNSGAPVLAGTGEEDSSHFTTNPTLRADAERVAREPVAAVAVADSAYVNPMSKERDPFGVSRINLEDSIWTPGSLKEVEWLNQHLYPSEQVVEQAALNYLDAEHFDADRSLNALDLAKAELLALRHPDIARNALDYLERAALSGSAYALTALSRFYGSSAIDDPVLSAAYQRAAEIQGDWALAGMRSDLSNEQRYLSDLEAYRIVAEIQTFRSAVGYSMALEPRPGLNDFLERVRAATEEGENSD